MSDNHLDSAVLSTLQDVMEGDFPILLDTFIADSEERLTALRDALARNDAQAVRMAAHSFKGSCSNMGAVLLAESCRSLEDLGRREQLADAPRVFGQIEREFAIVRILLKTERQRFLR